MNLPHRFTEKSFRRYEGVIKRAVESYPQTITIDPFPLSGTTYSARLRDAKVSLKQNRWPSTVNMERFLAVYEDLQVSDRGSSVVIGSSELIKVADKPLSAAGREMAGESRYTFDFGNDPMDVREIEAFVILLAARRLQGPIRVRPIAGIVMTRYQSTYDISIEELPDGSYTII